MRINNKVFFIILIFYITSSNANSFSTLTNQNITQDNFTSTAILQGLNKITAKTSRLTGKINTEIIFGKLSIIVKKCWKSPPDQKPENKILMKIIETNVDNKDKIVFYGWMFSSTPSVSGLEHPIYDITAIECQP